MFFPCLSALAEAPFASDFTAARTQFQQALHAFLAGPSACEHLAIDHPAVPGLATDVVYLGPRAARDCVVVISGTHGVEGFAGSAVQHTMLRQWAAQPPQLPADTAVLLIHALNPWGMQWARRCDDAGIDVNRNFVDFNTALPDNPDFDAVTAIFTIADAVERARLAEAQRRQLGEQRYQEAISGGQYRDAALPFYGGRGPSFSRQVIERVMAEFALADKRLLVIDIHTGLGPWAYGELICDHPIDTPQEAFAQRVFGAAVAVPARGTSFSVPKLGLLDYAWHRIMGPESCFLTLEFGSFDVAALFNVLIDDHLVWREREGTAAWEARRRASEAAMRGHFFPADALWRRSVMYQSLTVIERSLNAWSGDAK